MATTANELLAEDGAIVPQHLAAGVFNIIWRHCKAEQRDHGATLTPDMERLLRALNRVASRVPTAPTSSEGSDVGASEILGAHEVADILGCSRWWATALLGSGRLESTRVGRTWVTTRGDLDRFRFEEASDDGKAAGEGGEGGRRPPEQDSEAAAAS